jgi:hypothetical protein
MAASDMLHVRARSVYTACVQDATNVVRYFVLASELKRSTEFRGLFAKLPPETYRLSPNVLCSDDHVPRLRAGSILAPSFI